VKALCALDAIADGTAVIRDAIVEGEYAELILVRRGGKVWAYRNRCPHFSVGLDAQPGVIHTYGGEVMMCAHHSAMFRFEDGLCIDGPCQGHRLDAVAVQIDRGQVCLDTVKDASASSCLLPSN